MLKSYTNLLIVLLIISCINTTADLHFTDSLKQELLVADSIPTVDSILTLTSIAESDYKGPNLTDSLAMNTLYNYFHSKGFYTANELNEIDPLLAHKSSKACVRFTRIFMADLNGNKNKDAIILYWITPAFASGHCWQPHKAIIIDTDDGYKITNEEFIPDNFAIDSIQSYNNKLILFGYDYDCANQKVIKYYKAILKIGKP